ncbi:MAG: hypothetical protein IJB92_06080 [Clostridia bacterium]|nr:hypothetical protein [Clostridia bacterium]
MDTYTVSFFGHRYIENPLEIEKLLEKIISELLDQQHFIEFLIGNDGDFDRIATSAIRRCRRRLGTYNSSLTLVLPYATSDYTNNVNYYHESYDDIEICAHSSSAHFKAAHKIRNQEMIDRSNMAVFYVQNNKGGAFTAMQYAKKKGIDYINLCEK